MKNDNVIMFVLWVIGITLTSVIAFSFDKAYRLRLLETKISNAYDIFTNRTLSKDIEKSKQGDVLFMGYNSMELYTVIFTRKEIDRMEQTHGEFIDATILFALEGAFTNDWRGK